MLRRVDLVRIDVSEELNASFIRMSLVLPKHWFYQEPHGVTCQKTPFFNNKICNIPELEGGWCSNETWIRNRNALTTLRYNSNLYGYSHTAQLTVHYGTSSAASRTVLSSLLVSGTPSWATCSWLGPS
jgi:hypothetical protein